MKKFLLLPLVLMVGFGPTHGKDTSQPKLPAVWIEFFHKVEELLKKDSSSLKEIKPVITLQSQFEQAQKLIQELDWLHEEVAHPKKALEDLAWEKKLLEAVLQDPKEAQNIQKILRIKRTEFRHLENKLKKRGVTSSNRIVGELPASF